MTVLALKTKYLNSNTNHKGNAILSKYYPVSYKSINIISTAKI